MFKRVNLEIFETIRYLQSLKCGSFMQFLHVKPLSSIQLSYWFPLFRSFKDLRFDSSSRVVSSAVWHVSVSE